MPVLVEPLNILSYQDQVDLEKIYRDAPEGFFAPFADAPGLIDANLKDNLLAARFNDRLLGAACVQRYDGYWQLSHLCVRAPTRRRGVAERLVAHAQKSAADAGCQLRLLATAESPEVQALASKLHVPLHIHPDGIGG